MGITVCGKGSVSVGKGLTCLIVSMPLSFNEQVIRFLPCVEGG